MKTTEKNKLIAEFMGMYPHLETELEGWWFNTITAHPYDQVMFGGIKFHSSWDWLMPVVEKIESLNKGRFTVSITYSIVCIYDNSTDESIEVKQKPLTKIEAVYNACVEFILWYNKQNPA